MVARKPGNSGGAKGSRKMEGVMTNDPEDKSATVPVAQQAETAAVHSVWRTAKPHVWTDRMLTALVTGVKGGKWFRLIDKVYDERNLTAAFRQESWMAFTNGFRRRALRKEPF